MVSDAQSPRGRPSLRQRRSPVDGAAARLGRGWELQMEAWQWARANRASDGSLPSGKAIARQYGRHERWGRLVKQAGLAGTFTTNDQAA
jgi:hypothetical protein